MSKEPLTRGAIADIYNGNTDKKFVVQIVKIVKKTKTSAVISDGTHYMQAIFMQKVADKVDAGEIKVNTVVQINHCILKLAKEKKVVFIMAVDILRHEKDIIAHGNLKNIETVKQQLTSNAPKTPPKNVSTPPQQRMQQRQPQQRTNYRRSKSIETTEDLPQPQPIDTLNIYQPTWAIKARVTLKGAIRTWKKPTSEGKLCSINLLDEQGGEIRAVMFNAAVDKFYDLLQEGNVYIIAKGTLKHANKQFSAGIKNNLEISLGENSIVQLVEDDKSIDSIRFNFTKLSHLSSVKNNEVVDVLGVVESISEPKEFTSQKSGKQLKRQNLTIVDKNGNEKIAVELTLWNEVIDKFSDVKQFDVIAVKSVRKSDYNQVSLSATNDSKVVINPDNIIEANELREWYQSIGSEAAASSLTISTHTKSNFNPYLTLEAIDEQEIGKHQATNVKVLATVTFIKQERMFYDACPNDECKGKKVEKLETGYRCRNCNGEYETSSPRYSLFVCIKDHTKEKWVTAFGNAATSLLGGLEATDAKDLKENSPEEFKQHVESCTFSKFTFVLRCQERKFQDVEKMSYSVVQAWPSNSTEKEIEGVLKQIEKY